MGQNWLKSDIIAAMLSVDEVTNYQPAVKILLKLTERYHR